MSSSSIPLKLIATILIIFTLSSVQSNHIHHQRQGSKESPAVVAETNPTLADAVKTIVNDNKKKVIARNSANSQVVQSIASSAAKTVVAAAIQPIATAAKSVAAIAQPIATAAQSAANTASVDQNPSAAAAHRHHKGKSAEIAAKNFLNKTKIAVSDTKVNATAVKNQINATKTAVKPKTFATNSAEAAKTQGQFQPHATGLKKPAVITSESIHNQAAKTAQNIHNQAIKKAESISKIKKEAKINETTAEITQNAENIIDAMVDEVKKKSNENVDENIEENIEYQTNKHVDVPKNIEQNESTEITNPSDENKSVSSIEKLHNEGESVFVDPLTETSSAENQMTDTVYILNMTIKNKWSDEFKNKSSKKFRQLAESLDTELTSLIDNYKNVEGCMPKGSFKLANVVPSRMDEYLYVTIIVETNDNVKGEEVFDTIDMKVRLYGKLYEIAADLLGLTMDVANQQEIKWFEKHRECDNFEFCKESPVPTTTAVKKPAATQQPAPVLIAAKQKVPKTFNPSLKSSECQPNESIQREKTSIFVYENKECATDASKTKLNCPSTQSSEEKKDDLTVAASKIQPVVKKLDASADDEVVVVIRKRGGKVFIEI